jgi:acyl carrier protein
MLEKVIDIISEFTEVEKTKITAESGLVEDLGLNSLDVINVVVAFEDEFGIEIPDNKIKDLVTIGDIVECLKADGKN